MLVSITPANVGHYRYPTHDPSLIKLIREVNAIDQALYEHLFGSAPVDSVTVDSDIAAAAPTPP